jgi:hypothetical protein
MRSSAGVGEQLLHKRVHAVRVLAKRVSTAFPAAARRHELLTGGSEASRVREGTRRRRWIGFRHAGLMGVRAPPAEVAGSKRIVSEIHS